MPARLTAYLPDRAAIVRILDDDGTWTLGRAPDCRLVLDHPSISRLHAQLYREGSHWRLQDAGSKNGCFVDGERVGEALLDAACWLRLGDLYCEYELLPAGAARTLAQRTQTRRADSALLLQRAAAADDLDGLLGNTLAAALELSGCERGFLLLGAEGALAVRAAVGIDARLLGRAEFSGSVGAVSRALAERRPVVVNDIGAAPWLRERGSVVSAGIRALACVPMWEDGDAGRHRLIGAVYVDSCRAHAQIAELDLDLLRAFVDAMALRIATAAAAQDLGSLAAAAVDWPAPVAGAGA